MILRSLEYMEIPCKSAIQSCYVVIVQLADMQAFLVDWPPGPAH